jgi:hypothetical protein
MTLLHSGLPREDVFAGFVMSKEFDELCDDAGIDRGVYTPPPGGRIKVFLTRLYRNTLDREPDKAGLDGWTSMLLAGTTGADVAYGFFFSPEMAGKFHDNYWFVELLYRTLLDRNSDAEGRSYWIAELNRGVPRTHIFAGFANSVEFEAMCADNGIIRGYYTPPPIPAQAPPVINQNGVRVTPIATYHNAFWNLEWCDEEGKTVVIEGSEGSNIGFAFLVENTTSESISFEMFNFRVNGIRYHSGAWNSVISGASRIVTLNIEVPGKEIPAINTATFDFWYGGDALPSLRDPIRGVSFTPAPVTAWPSWWGVEHITIAPGGDIDKVLMDINGIKVTYAGAELVEIEYEETWYDSQGNENKYTWTEAMVEFNFEVENNSHRGVTLNSSTIYINGRPMGVSFSRWIPFGEIDEEDAIMTLSIHPSTIGGHGINTINNMQIRFSVGGFESDIISFRP